MITLITGVPGSSKTLNTINEVLTNDTYKNRPVYYYNIPEVQLEWHQLDEAGAKDWFNLPHGSVVILDECQRLFRPMKYGDKVPQYIEELETHRHLGIDLFVITQHPKLIDTKVRRLVGRHLHFKRQFGMESATRIEFQKCADDPDDYFALKESIKTRVKFPKKLYGVYKSSEEHTHKRRLPKKLFGIVAFLFLAVGLIYKAVAGFGENQTVDPIPSPIGSIAPERSTDRGPSDPDPVLTYAQKWSPRLQQVPWSAPVYDGLTEPVTFPRPQCIIRHSDESCSCFTQQATPLDIDQATCRNYATQGYFDPTRPDVRSAKGSGGKSEASAETGAGVSIAHERVMEALRIRGVTKDDLIF